MSHQVPYAPATPARNIITVVAMCVPPSSNTPPLDAWRVSYANGATNFKRNDVLYTRSDKGSKSPQKKTGCLVSGLRRRSINSCTAVLFNLIVVSGKFEVFPTEGLPNSGLQPPQISSYLTCPNIPLTSIIPTKSIIDTKPVETTRGYALS